MDRPPPFNESEVVRFEHHRDVSLQAVELAVRLAVPDEDSDQTSDQGSAQIVEVREWIEGEATAFVAIVHRLSHAERDPLIRVSCNYALPLGRAGAVELLQTAQRWWERRGGVTGPRTGRGR
jgi:hypothetical protein